MSSVNLRKFDFKAALFCVCFVFLWSLGPNFVKFLTVHLDHWTQNMLRYIVAALFWLPFLILSIKKKQFDKTIWKKALIPAVANTAMQTLFTSSFYYLNPAFLNLICRSSVIWIVSFSLIFFVDERPLVRSCRFWVGMILSLTGVIGVLVFKEDFLATRTITGIILALSTAVVWGVYTVTVKSAFRDTDSRACFSVISIYTAVILSVLTLIFGKVQDCLAMPLWPWAAIVISAIASIALSHVLYYAAMRRIGATIPSLVLLLTPFTVLTISRVIYGESLNPMQWLFGLILLTGAAIAIWAQQHLKPTTQND